MARYLCGLNIGFSYIKRRADDGIAKQLTLLFAPQQSSPIKTYRDAHTSHWGLTIHGGEQLREENLPLLPAMVEKFLACLGTLSDAELLQMKEVLYSPLLLNAPEGGIHLSEEKKRVATLMFTNFQTNKCDNANTLIPELLHQRVRQYLAALLAGKFNGIAETSGALLVITTLYRDLLFSANGLWVRTTLAHLQDFINKRLTLLPTITDESFLNYDYESFLDFVLLSRRTSDLSMENYLGLAKAFAITGIEDAFKPFPLKRNITRGQVHVFKLHLGSRSSTVFFEGAKL